MAIAASDLEDFPEKHKQNLMFYALCAMVKAACKRCGKRAAKNSDKLWVDGNTAAFASIAETNLRRVASQESKGENVVEENKIRAVHDDNTIRVYQAYKVSIAAQAVQKGTFGSHFKLDRMTWIKPSFLWMMYRCGWAQKPGQERVLAIDLKREAFDFLVSNAIRSTYNAKCGWTNEEWKKKIRESDIRVQWDPERDIYGNPQQHRSIQLGFRGRYAEQYVQNWIVGISDITDYVVALKGKIDNGFDVASELPKEKEYRITGKEEFSNR